jgi:hypothetical protein
MKKLLILCCILLLGCVAAYAVMSIVHSSATATYTDTAGNVMPPATITGPDLSVSHDPHITAVMTADKTNVKPGEVVTFTVVLTNDGTDGAKAVKVTLDAALGGGNVIAGDIAAGASKTITVTGKAN